MSRIEKIARETPGVKHTVAIAGQSILLNANAPNFGSMFVMLDDFHDRTEPELSGDAIAARLQATLAGRGRRRPGQRLRRPAGRGPGHRRRLQDHDRGPRRRRPGGAAGASPTTVVAEATEHAGPRRACSPASAPTRRSCTSTSTATKAKTMGVSIERGLQHLQVYLGSLLRQRLQPLRPHLAGERPGRRRLPQADRGPQAAQGPQRAGRDGAAGRRSASVRDVSGPVHDHALQHVPGRRDQRRRRARASARARRSTLMERLAEQRAAAVDATEWTELALLAAADRQHGHATSSCWRWCWSSWCWRRSTRAGRCRWR